MKLYPLTYEPISATRATFRQSRIALTITLAIVIALFAVGIWAVGLHMPAPPVAAGGANVMALIGHVLRNLPVFGWIMGGGMLLITAVIFAAFLKSFRRHNWVLKILDREVLVNLRSYTNTWADPADPVVACIAMEEIANISSHVEKYTVPGSEGDVLHSDKYLEIRLRHDETADVRSAIHRELTQRPPPRRVGSATVQTGPAGCLVWLASSSTIRVPFRTASLCVRPSLERALEMLAMSVRVDDPIAIKMDRHALDDAQFRSLVAKLVLQGEVLDAESLLRERYKLNTTEAHNLREEIERQQLDALAAGKDACPVS